VIPTDEIHEVKQVPIGKVKWYDNDKGFGILTADDGREVFLRANALAPGTGEIKPGTRMEFGVADGRKGAQAMAAKVIDRGPSVAKAKRMPARDLAPIVQDLVSLLEHSVGSLTNGKYPEGDASKIAAALRKVADNFDA
jgi:CspA family cold shock protein